MIKRRKQKIGFYRKTKESNCELIFIFDEIQRIRAQGTDKNWAKKSYIKKLTTLEKKAFRKILTMLKEKKLKTPDDFYRASFIFHHGPSFRYYMIAVALAAISNHLGEPRGKNIYAVAIDRLLLSLGLPQHFGSQYIKKNGKWQLDKYDPKTTDKERVEYTIEPLTTLKKHAREMYKTTVWTYSSKGQ